MEQQRALPNVHLDPFIAYTLKGLKPVFKITPFPGDTGMSRK